jgi:hypothetical protein
LEMVGPYLEQTIEDKMELNREKIKALIQAPLAFDLIKEDVLKSKKKKTKSSKKTILEH